MELITILNRCYRQKGFVYRNASFVGQHHHEIEVSIVPRKHTRANCSGCGKPCPGYDRLPQQQSQWKEAVNRYHYLGASTPFGASIRYWIMGAEKPLGCMQFSSPAWKMAARDRWIGWSGAARQKNLH
jgi:hypothetical protein